MGLSHSEFFFGKPLFLHGQFGCRCVSCCPRQSSSYNRRLWTQVFDYWQNKDKGELLNTVFASVSDIDLRNDRLEWGPQVREEEVREL